MIPISKLSATGNDFLLVGLHTSEILSQWQKDFSHLERGVIAKRLCDRHEGIGADGMLFFSSDENADFAWDFYNQDGSGAAMCGNAARCAGLWASRISGEWRNFSFQTEAGLVNVQRLANGLIEAQMPTVMMKQENFELRLSAGKVKLSLVDSGVPHAVIRQESLKERDVLRSQAQELRFHPEFGSGGANVTFYLECSSEKISTLTFERGVEDFTRACGTGAVAAAYLQHLRKGSEKIHVHVPGGELMVDLNQARPRLSGPAHWVADCYADLSADGILKP